MNNWYLYTCSHAIVFVCMCVANVSVTSTPSGASPMEERYPNTYMQWKALCHNVTDVYC